MLYDFVFLLILFALIYSYISSQEQFSATASAIGQIWSGNCHLSCRHSQQSGISGLSGLPGPPYTVETSHTGPGVSHGNVEAKGTMPGSSRECHCESCPCALIENFLRTCRPATNIYAELLQCTSNCITYFIQMMEDAYFYMMRVFECNASCQRQGQITNTGRYMDGEENFSFGKGDKENNVDKVKSALKAHFPDSSQSGKNFDENIIPMRSNLPEPMQQGTSKDIPDTVDSKNANIPDSSDDSVIQKEKGFCSKCIEKGRTCLKECPRANKKK